MNAMTHHTHPSAQPNHRRQVEELLQAIDALAATMDELSAPRDASPSLWETGYGQGRATSYRLAAKWVRELKDVIR